MSTRSVAGGGISASYSSTVCVLDAGESLDRLCEVVCIYSDWLETVERGRGWKGHTGRLQESQLKVRTALGIEARRERELPDVAHPDSPRADVLQPAGLADLLGDWYR